MVVIRKYTTAIFVLLFLFLSSFLNTGGERIFNFEYRSTHIGPESTVVENYPFMSFCFFFSCALSYTDQETRWTAVENLVMSIHMLERMFSWGCLQSSLVKSSMNSYISVSRFPSILCLSRQSVCDVYGQDQDKCLSSSDEPELIFH